MLFHTLDYVLFLAVAVAGYWMLVRLHLLRVLFIFLASCVFYMAWNPIYIGLILASTTLDYCAGRGMGATENPRIRKAWLICSLTGNLGLLGAFKYYNFFTTVVADTFGLMGLEVSLPTLDVLLPVGISFYTFQTLSYTIDVYRGKLAVEKSFIRFAAYVTFFPQLVAGPIVRAVELLPQLQRKVGLDKNMPSEGLFLISVGMAKKLALSDYVAVNLVDRVFDNPAAFTSAEVLIGLYGYTLQIYCDFSGYTDIARGSAMLMGLRLPENFNQPYLATSPAEFWRRWHITLSSWLRDYLYFPLGGSRGGPVRAYVNLWLTMFIVGIWHGAAWTFVLYALVHAGAMVTHRFFYRMSGRTKDTVDPTHIRILKIIGTVHFSVFSRILFRGTSVDNAWDVASQLFEGTMSLVQVSPLVWTLLLVGYASHYVPPRIFHRIKSGFAGLPVPVQGMALAGLGMALMNIATTDVVPYIYFQF